MLPRRSRRRVGLCWSLPVRRGLQKEKAKRIPSPNTEGNKTTSYYPSGPRYSALAPPKDPGGVEGTDGCPSFASGRVVSSLRRSTVRCLRPGKDQRVTMCRRTSLASRPSSWPRTRICGDQ